MSSSSQRKKILICDDNESIHEDFRFTLGYSESRTKKKEIANKLSALIDDLDESATPNSSEDRLKEIEYDLDFAKQGEEAIHKVVNAEKNNSPYALIFMDIRMPPGIDGIQTIKLLRKDYPHLEFVICTAFSDYNWDEISKEIGYTDKVLFITKPFDPTAIKQIALSQTMKFELIKENKLYREKLESLVEKRTKQLKSQINEIKEMQKTLVNQEKLASLGTMTAGIAHELKNPLNFITNFSDSLSATVDEINQNIKDGCPDNSINELTYLVHITSQKIKDHTNRANIIIENMLLHSRGEGLKSEPIVINEIINKYFNLSYVSAKSLYSGFQCQNIINIDENIKPSQLVVQDIGRVFINLISNAYYSMNEKRKSNKDYQPKLEITSSDKNDGFEIKIKDNGCGISDDHIKKIFDPFYTTKPTGIGTGLGLSISYDIITNQHQGTLVCKSKSGEWTEFLIFLPYLNNLKKRNVA